jgi:hypothetical protein
LNITLCLEIKPIQRPNIKQIIKASQGSFVITFRAEKLELEWTVVLGQSVSIIHADAKVPIEILR